MTTCAVLRCPETPIDVFRLIPVTMSVLLGPGWTDVSGPTNSPAAVPKRTTGSTKPVAGQRAWEPGVSLVFLSGSDRSRNN
jgi:hypothetical protein